MEPLDLPDIGEQEVTESDYEFGIGSPLKAKSHSGSGSILHDHLLQAGRMALTVSETVHVSPDFRDRFRKAALIGGIYHDLGKAAAGFQEMLKNHRTKRWPPKRGGYRHEMLSSVLFLANSINQKIWKENLEMFWAVYLSIIVHHKPFRKKSSGNYPKIIKIAQWPGNKAFKKMYKELLLNKTSLLDCWASIISEIKSDDWGMNLINEGFLSDNLIIPDTVDKVEEIYSKFTNNYSLPGYNKGIIRSTQFYHNVPKQTSKFITYVRAVVTVGDHLSSGNYLFLPPVPELRRYEVFDNFQPRKFQTNCGINGHLLLRAPTGSGKTEAAQHWIQNNQITDNNRLAKVFFVLPFQASINAMFERLGEWIGYDKGMIGLQHSRAAQVLFGIIEEEIYEGNRDQVLHNGRRKVKKYHDPWSEFENIKTLSQDQFSDLLLNDGYQRDYWTSPVKKQINTAAYSIDGLTRENFYPIKVTTPHQLLGAVLHGRGWEVSIQEFEEACFVFDEIHVYDPHLTGLILGMASVLIKEFNANIMFMSASFPTFLIDLINEYVIEDIPLIELDESETSDNEVLENYRHIITVEDRTITSLLQDEEFLADLLQHESILIICNTVAVAQEIYNLLQGHEDIEENQVLLFHSRFKMEDRKDKEAKIMNIADTSLKFVVATQVVEVSLDIDLAFGIFEAAPLDALTQRLGRVNRRGKRELDTTNIVICRPDGGWKYVYNEEITDYSITLLQSIEDKKVSEMKLVELIDDLYSHIPWNENQMDDFKLAFGNGKYQDFFSQVLPGTYSRWIDEVIVEKSTVDVLHPFDVNEYYKRMNKEPLRALDLLIPARVYKGEYHQKSSNDPKILTDKWKYNSEIGLYKEENNK